MEIQQGKSDPGACLLNGLKAFQVATCMFTVYEQSFTSFTMLSEYTLC